MVRLAGLALCLVLVVNSVAAATVTLFDSPARDTRPDGCEARVVSRSGSNAASGPCGVPLEVPFGDAIGWIERTSEITPYVTDVSEGGAYVLDRFVGAGNVTFGVDQLSSGQRLWLVAFGGPLGRKVFQHPVVDARRPHKVPAGRVVAVVIDGEDRALRMSPLVRVPYRGTVHVQPERPSDGGNLIAFIGAPDAGHNVAEVEKLWATDANGSRPPAALVPGSDGIVAVWYGLSGPVTVEIAARALWLPNATLELAPREIGLLRQQLRPLPDLTVELDGLEDAAPKVKDTTFELSLVKRTAEGEVIRRVTVEPGSVSVFEALTPAAYDVVVQVDGFEIRKDVDLSSGDDVRVKIPLEPITISGTVYRGGTAVQAEIRFLQRGAPAVVKTAEDGSYHATIWRPQRYFVDLVPVDDPNRPPFREMVRIVADRQLDFTIPDKRLGARIFDAESRQPIAGAAISLRSSYVDASGRKAQDVLAFRSGEQPITDLPPQRPGTAELNVQAEGYENAGPVTVTVDAADGVAIVDVAMHRTDATAPSVEVRLPGARPAAAAEMAIVSNGVLLPWRGTADAGGVIRLPNVADGSFLLVRHRDVASAIVRYVRGSIPAIDLLPSAPPLLLRVIRRDGAAVGPQGVRITLWSGDVRLTGAAAGFMTWSAGVTAADGTWLARNLPQRGVRVLATNSAAAADVDAGRFDNFATTIAYPWPAAPSVRLAE